MSDVMSSPVADNPFESATELREQHERLLDLVDGRLQQLSGVDADRTARAELEPEIREFLRRGVATGVFLEEIRERTACQVLLDYWGSGLPDAGPYAAPLRLARFDVERLPDLRDKECPYVGLEAFHSREFFFGREHDTQELVQQIRESPLTVVLGGSGSGKSSLVMGGVLPALSSAAEEPLFRVLPSFVPGSSVLESLAETLLNASGQPTDAAAVARVAGELRSDPARLPALLADTAQARVLLTVDQFEEVFTLSPPGDREAISASLAALLDRGNQHRIVLTMREEFRSQIMALTALAPYLDRCWYSMRPMGYDELREAVEGPAALVNLRFQAGIPEDIVKRVLGQPAALPLLQFTLRLLWDARDRNRITWEVYRRVGDPLKALEASADAFYTGLARETQAEVKRVLLELVRVDDLLEAYRQPVRRSVLLQAGRANTSTVLALLERADYIRVKPQSGSDGTGDAVVEVKHESLVRNWPLLVGWIDEKRHLRRQRLALTQAAEGWAARNRPGDGLLTGWQLEEAKAQRDLSPTEREFVESSIDAANRERLEREEAIRRDAQQQIRTAARRQRLMWLSGAAVMLIAGMAALSVVLDQLRRAQEVTATSAVNEKELLKSAAVKEQESDRRQAADRARREKEEQVSDLVVRALSVRAEEDPELAIVAGVSAANAIEQLDASDGTVRVPSGVWARLYSGWQNSAALAGVQIHAAVAGGLLDEGRTATLVERASLSADGKRAVLVTNGRMSLWALNARAPSVISRFPDTPPSPGCVLLSPDGTRIISAWDDGAVRLFESSGAKLRVIMLAPATERIPSQMVADCAYSGDGNYFARALRSATSAAAQRTAGEEGGRPVAFALQIWNVPTGEPVALDASNSFFEAATFKIALSFDGRLLAEARSRNVSVYGLSASGLTLNCSAPGPLRCFNLGVGEIPGAVALSRSNAVAAGLTTGSIRGLAGAPGDLTADAGVTSLAFSPQLDLLGALSDDASTAYVWDLRTGDRSTFSSPHASFLAIAFSTTGEAVTADAGGMIRFWRASPASGQVSNDLELADNVTFSPDGKYLLTGREYGVKAWDSRYRPSGPQIFTCRNPSVASCIATASDSVEHLEFVGNNATLALLTSRGALTLRRFPDGTELASTEALGEGGTFAVSPSHHLIATAVNGSVQVWRLSGSTLRPSLELKWTGSHPGVNTVAFGSDGRLASGGGNRVILIWDVTRGTPVKEIRAGDSVQALAFSNEGLHIAAGTGDLERESGFVKIWRLGSSQSNPDVEPVFASREEGMVRALAFSPDGKRFAVGSRGANAGRNGGVAKVFYWDPTNEDVGPLLAFRHRAGVWSLAFSPDGRRLAVGIARHNSTRVWQIPREDEIVSLAEQRWVRRLTDKECDRFFPLRRSEASLVKRLQEKAGCAVPSTEVAAQP